MQEKVKFHTASMTDIQRLVSIENLCFGGDKLNSKSFRYFLKKKVSGIILVSYNGIIAGYGLLLSRKDSKIARIYSIAIDPDFRGLGLGEKLLEKLEQQARKNKITILRLEVKPSNKAARALYKSNGYVEYAVKADYYENHEEALCLQKSF